MAQDTQRGGIGGNKPPLVGGGDPPNQTLRQQYVDNGWGALVCWGMPSFTGTEQASPDLDPDTFAPTGLDVGQWLDACVAAGMTYVTLVAKHHDGFALWPTAYAVTGNDPYSIAQTAWYAANGSPDIVAQFVSGCNSRGLKPFLYFSILDTTYETRSGTDETTDAAGYWAMITTQLTELLTNYGDIGAIWLDGFKWHLGYNEISFEQVYHLVKSIHQGTLVIDNNHEHPTFKSEIEVYEPGYIGDGPLPDGNIRMVEVVETVRSDLRWFDVSSQNYRTVGEMETEIIHANTNNATYTLGIQVGLDGELHADMVTLMGQIVA